MNYTPEQEKCVTCFQGPLDISAGAGSGKTFTLTQRIVQALKDPESGVDDIDQILAITFTRKAASELKGRVRQALRAEGMLEQSLKVDGAWISTIHGMCSRILRTAALEVGQDPSFSLLEDSEQVLSDAIDEVLKELGLGVLEDGAAYSQLLKAYPLVSEGGFGGASVTDMLKAILETAHSLPGGFDDMHRLPITEDASELARKLLANYEEARNLCLSIKSSASQEKNLVAADIGIASLEMFLQGQNKTPADLLECLETCKRLGATCGTSVQKDALKEYAATHSECVLKAALLQSELLLDQLLALAQRVEEVFARRKRDLAVLDNGDLIKGAMRALENPSVAAQYQDKFRLVMVDEFQDTDALQLAIVSQLSGLGQRYLCTVGDAQQSIYGFRGADVSLYRSYQKHLFDQSVLDNGGKPQTLQLSKNFRSHNDVLALVKMVCSQPSVFGEDFLDLSAGYDGSGYRGQGPRVRLDVVTTPPVGGKIDDTLEAQALRIVEFFSQMRADGHELSEMALLLGVSTHARDYARYLRAAGFECVISGGSNFVQTTEAQMVADISRALINPKDTEGLFNVATSSLFELSADDVLAAATEWNEASDGYVRRSLDAGFSVMTAALYGENGEEFAQENPALAQVLQVLSRARSILYFQPLSKAVAFVLRESGCLARLQAGGPQGCADAANLLKALRLLEGIEQQEDFGAATVCARYCRMLERGVKEAPGSLNVAGQQAIRIMTIHASKGLEFPIVALADFMKTPRNDALLIQRVQGQSYCVLFPKGEKIANVDLGAKAFAAFSSDIEPCGLTVAQLESMDCLRARAILRQQSAADALSEQQRLFYVGATRAKEALGLFVRAKAPSKNATSAFSGIYDDLARALFEDGKIPLGESVVEYGGSQPLLVRHELAAPADQPEDALNDAGEAGDARDAGEAVTPQAAETPVQKRFFDVYEPCDERMLPAYMVPQKARGFFSYSSLDGKKISASTLEDLSFVLTPEAGEEDDPEEVPRHLITRAADDDKATVFGEAFHRTAQLSMLAGPSCARDRMRCIAQTYGVVDDARLERALSRWLESRACARAMKAFQRFPELPFTVGVAPVALSMEGAIDLLCVEDAANPLRCAYVVDYKTGGKDSETLKQLQEKHALQACCYAYALFAQGYERVELDFVRVEHDDPRGEDSLQTVSFAFEATAAAQLEDLICERVRESLPMS